MIDCTDKVFRQFIRLISRHVYLYTEMITSHAILNGDAERLLAFDAVEHPVAIQLGGSDPQDLARAAKISETFGYDEVNLNVGCPSSRVQAGAFGACLMKTPSLVADCVSAMQQAVSIPVTVKCRIGVDEIDDYEAFQQFIDTVRQSGCKTFIVHARKAWLKGLSPKQNRTIPELKYEFVHQIKHTFPELEIIINGGINDLDKQQAFANLDGIMVGREAYGNPYHLSVVDQMYQLSPNEVPSRKSILLDFAPFADHALQHGFPPSILMKHVFGLSHGVKGGSAWRRTGTELLQKVKVFGLSQYFQWIEQFPE